MTPPRRRAAESLQLAPYAAHDAQSHGRVHLEPPPVQRTEFQRDRDRIVHCTAFRRLVYKTQVYVNHEGDLYRTRITHSLEVAQIGRTAARALRLNETLTEAICLAHDLGHTPFGHAGQDALNACMRDYGGFEHNLQSLRIVDELEERYAAFRGLNLTFETREGILKHCSAANARQLGPLGERFLKRRQPSLEAQLANLADEIAYNNHDLDDGLRAGLIRAEQLGEVPLFAREHRAVRDQYPDASLKRLVSETIRRMIDRVVRDLIQTTQAQIEAAGVQTIEEVRALKQPLVGFSPKTRAEHLELKAFLRDHVYRHYRVLRMTNKARRVLRELFEVLITDVALLPPDHRSAAEREAASAGPRGRARIVADYVAGMTDRYAILEHRRLFSPAERS